MCEAPGDGEQKHLQRAPREVTVPGQHRREVANSSTNAQTLTQMTLDFMCVCVLRWLGGCLQKGMTCRSFVAPAATVVHAPHLRACSEAWRGGESKGREIKSVGVHHTFMSYGRHTLRRHLPPAPAPCFRLRLPAAAPERCASTCTCSPA